MMTTVRRTLDVDDNNITTMTMTLSFLATTNLGWIIPGRGGVGDFYNDDDDEDDNNATTTRTTIANHNN